jgi:hypothetical protein
VKTTSATRFDGQCTQIVNGAKVEVEGARQPDGSVLAGDVEIK